jgi:SHS2 domain-containing protein
VQGTNREKIDSSAVKSGDSGFAAPRNNRCGVENLKLSATIWGEKINQAKHSPAVEPKAVTYNQLSVKNEKNKWIVQCVIDV